MKEKFEDAKFLKVSAGVRYWEDAQIDGVYDDKDNPKMQFVNDIKTSRGIKKYWQPLIDLSKGQVVDWNVGTSAFVHYKVCDDGHYELLNANKEVIANADDWEGGSYVPAILDCSEDRDAYGDYIILRIDENGFIKDFYKRFDWFKRVDFKCVAGCKHFTGGEIYHHKDCQFYPSSMSKKYDEMRDLLVKMEEYLRPQHAGQINSINTTSIFHNNIIEILK